MYYSLESFIRFCDEMEIVEESMKSIDDNFKKYLAEIKELTSILKSEDNIDKIISIEKQILTITKKYTQLINDDNVTKGDKLRQLAKVGIGVGVAALSAVFGTISHKDYLAIIGGGVGGGFVGNATMSLQNPKMIKDVMNATVKSQETTITALQKLKSLGFKSYKEARSKYKVKIGKDGAVNLIERKK